MNIIYKILIIATVAAGIFSIVLYCNNRQRQPSYNPSDYPHAKTATIAGVYWKSKRTPPFFSVDKMSKTTDLFIAIEEWLPDEDSNQLVALYALVGHNFVFKAPDHPDVRISLDGFNYNNTPKSIQGFGAQINRDDRDKLKSGVKYIIKSLDHGKIPWRTNGVTFIAP